MLWYLSSYVKPSQILLKFSNVINCMAFEYLISLTQLANIKFSRTTVSQSGRLLSSGRASLFILTVARHWSVPWAGVATGPRRRYANWTNVLHDLLWHGLTSYNLLATPAAIYMLLRCRSDIEAIRQSYALRRLWLVDSSGVCAASANVGSSAIHVWSDRQTSDTITLFVNKEINQPNNYCNITDYFLTFYA